ncbi:MAG: hypothetical protein CMF60_06075 [Magnetococcales bacterium]|nr:hypothetical protein [Magnetococcales bacterium]|tara:strand:- start:3216 stop:3758 length:543 start_codon:yes stop_codon:yes gene_type:complete
MLQLLHPKTATALRIHPTTATATPSPAQQASKQLWDLTTGNHLSTSQFKALFLPHGLATVTFHAVLKKYGCHWGELFQRQLKKWGQSTLQKCPHGLIVAQQYYLSLAFCQKLDPAVFAAIVLLALHQDQSLEMVCDNNLTKKLNINLTNAFAEISHRYKWLDGKKIAKSKAEQVYGQYSF